MPAENTLDTTPSKTARAGVLELVLISIPKFSTNTFSAIGCLCVTNDSEINPF